MTRARDERGGIASILGIVLAALALGAAGGYVTGQLTEAQPGLTATVPLEAASPSVPFTPYSPDVVFPDWQPGLDYRHTKIGVAPFAWRYDVPRGWTSFEGDGEVKWGVPGHPVGSYGFRIAQVSVQHESVQGMVASKLAELRSAVADVRVLTQNSNTLAITYRSVPENWLRYNTFRWFALPGSESAAIEISVNGRTEDLDGMNDLLEHVSDTLESRP